MTLARALLVVACVAACEPASKPPGSPNPAPSSEPRAAKPPGDALTPARWPDVTLPRSTVAAPLPTGIPTLVVSKTAIRLDGEPPLLPLPADRAQGMGAKYMGGPEGLLIRPLEARLLKTKAHEVVFVFDASTPYRLATEVMFTAGQSELATFHFAVSHDGVVAELRSTPPRAAAQVPPRDPARQLSFVVMLVGEGITLKTRGGSIAPGCKELGPGIAIPKKGGAYDFDALRACATLLRVSNEESVDDHGVVVSANPDVAFGDIVKAIDRVRVGNEGEPLFPELVFGVAR